MTPVVASINPAPTRGPTAFATLFIPAEKASKNPVAITKIVKTLFHFPLLLFMRSAFYHFPNQKAMTNETSGTIIQKDMTIKSFSTYRD